MLGAVNGVGIQHAIERQCSGASRASETRYPTNVHTNWKSTNLTLPQCLARAREFVQNFQRVNTLSETVFAWHEDTTLVISCVPRMSVVFFFQVSPGNEDPNKTRAMGDLFGQIVDRF